MSLTKATYAMISGSVYNVLDFGAVGDGTTDNTAAIQSAIDTAAAAKGGEVFFPAGVYSTGTIVLKEYVHLVGEPKGVDPYGLKTIVNNTTAPTQGSVLVQKDSTGDVISTPAYPVNTRGCGVHNLYIFGKNSATAGRGIYFSPNVWWSVIENCTVRNFADEGIFLNGLANEVSKCFLGNNVLYNTASLTFYKGQIGVFGTDHILSKNEVSGPSSPTVIDGAPLNNANLYCPAILLQSVGSTIFDNVFEISDIGIAVVSSVPGSSGASRANVYYPGTCSGNNVHNNRIDNNGGPGIQVTTTNSVGGPSENTFTGNMIWSCGQHLTDTYSGIQIQIQSNTYFPFRNFYSNNTFNNLAGATNLIRFGIYSDAYTLPSDNGDRFLTNRISGYATAPTGGVYSLDYYNQGTFTPVITCAVPGNLTVVYSVQNGSYTKIGNRIFYNVYLNCSTFTHSTATGSVSITGFPEEVSNTPATNTPFATMYIDGYTKAGYTTIGAIGNPNTTIFSLIATGSGTGQLPIDISDLPTGSAKAFRFSGHYDVDNI